MTKIQLENAHGDPYHSALGLKYLKVT